MLRQGFRLATLRGPGEGRVVRHSRERGNPVLKDVGLLYKAIVKPMSIGCANRLSCPPSR